MFIFLLGKYESNAFYCTETNRMKNAEVEMENSDTHRRFNRNIHYIFSK